MNYIVRITDRAGCSGESEYETFVEANASAQRLHGRGYLVYLYNADRHDYDTDGLTVEEREELGA